MVGRRAGYSAGVTGVVPRASTACPRTRIRSQELQNYPLPILWSICCTTAGLPHRQGRPLERTARQPSTSSPAEAAVTVRPGRRNPLTQPRPRSLAPPRPTGLARPPRTSPDERPMRPTGRPPAGPAWAAGGHSWRPSRPAWRPPAPSRLSASGPWRPAVADVPAGAAGSLPGLARNLAASGDQGRLAPRGSADGRCRARHRTGAGREPGVVAAIRAGTDHGDRDGAGKRAARAEPAQTAARRHGHGQSRSGDGRASAAGPGRAAGGARDGDLAGALDRHRPQPLTDHG